MLEEAMRKENFSLEEISTQNGPFNFNSNSMSSCVSNEIALNLKYRIGIKHLFNINLGIGIIKKTTFFLYFKHISLCFYSNFNRESSLDAELNSTSNAYPLGILLLVLSTPKTRNT